MVSKLKGKFYVTTAIDYPNGKPHVGHAIEKIQADVLARWNRIEGKKVFYLTGTDEHGLKIQNAAQAANVEPKQFVDSMAAEFKDAWQMLNISNDRFIRTTDEDHEKAVAKLIKTVYKNGDIYKGTYEGLYCVGCERFYTEKELDNGYCKIHKTKCEQTKEPGYFFKLSKYKDKLLEFYEKNPDFIWPRSRREEIINRVKEGLEDLSITRASFKWGVPFPLNKKLITYVWFDALPNYITGIEWPRGKFKKFWPADVHIIGKDIAWFHCVIWPAILMSAGIEPPKRVFIHGFLTIEGQKMSKSLGNVIDPRELVKNYGVDTIRYYFLREISSWEDGDVSERSIVKVHNTELADNIGNLVNRSIVLAEKYFPKVPKKKVNKDIASKAEKLVGEVREAVENQQFNVATELIMHFASEVNAYINETKPWENEKKRGEIVYTLLESLRYISTLLYPFIPTTAVKIAIQLGLREDDLSIRSLKKFGKLKPGTKFVRGSILFQKFENHDKPAEAIQKVAQKVGKKIEKSLGGEKMPETHATIDDVTKLDLRVAQVKTVEMVENSDKLYKISIDVGGEAKQIVAGIKASYAPQELEGKFIIVVNNMKPREYKQFGLVSEAMLLAAEDSSGPVLLTTDRKVISGAGIR